MGLEGSSSLYHLNYGTLGISGIQSRPGWLDALYTEQFFIGCPDHEYAKKNEKNVLCVDCCTSICPHCLPSHWSHRLLQVRRYVYHEVIRLEDLEKLIDCTNVQAYTINSSKVVFIKKRKQNRQFKGSGNYCTSCDRSLQEPYFHCSLGCKVEFILKHNKDLSPYLKRCKTLRLGPDFLLPQDMLSMMGIRNYDINNNNEHQEQEEDDTTNDLPLSTIMDSSSDELMMSSSSGSENTSFFSHAIHIVRKKRSGLTYIPSTSPINLNNNGLQEHQDMMIINRRKGIPQRSPLY
uniref:B box-type domain-containing protein n=1 Tax=Kalanchoe fedtschenkoi TaxID=63787 RepID=A0A7N0V735_KALFE